MIRTSFLALTACLLGVSPVLAAGGSSADSPATPTASPEYRQAETSIKTGRYRQAARLLENMVASDPGNADAFNLLGYSYRRLGDTDQALRNYHKALELNSGHKGAHEYIGELYLEMGNLEKAEYHLDRLDTICFFGCDEYRTLRDAVAAYRVRSGG